MKRIWHILAISLIVAVIVMGVTFIGDSGPVTESEPYSVMAGMAPTGEASLVLVDEVATAPDVFINGTMVFLAVTGACALAILLLFNFATDPMRGSTRRQSLSQQPRYPLRTIV